MDFMEKITELRAQKGQLLKEAEGLVTDGKFEEADQITAKMEAINGQIAGRERRPPTTAPSTTPGPGMRARERTSPLPPWGSS